MAVKNKVDLKAEAQASIRTGNSDTLASQLLALIINVIDSFADVGSADPSVLNVRWSIVKDISVNVHNLAGDEDVPTDGKFYGKVNGSKGWFVPPAAAHTHAIADVTNLQTELNGKAASAHTHVIADVTNLQTELNGKAASAHTHAIADVTNLQTELNSKAASAHTHAIADVTNLQTELNNRQATSQKNTANGYAGLDANSKLTASQIPNIVNFFQVTEQENSVTASGSTATIDFSLGTKATLNITASTAVALTFAGISAKSGFATIRITGNAQNITFAVGTRQNNGSNAYLVSLTWIRASTNPQVLVVNYYSDGSILIN